MAGKITDRVSYRYFKEYLDFFNTNPSRAETLRLIHKIIDDRRGFHSQTNSDRVRESLEFLIKEECGK